MFIVTEGSENIKLGNVEVMLIEKSQVRRLLQIKQSAIQAEIESQKKEVKVATEAVDIAQKNFDAFMVTRPFEKSEEYLRLKADRNALNQPYTDLEKKVAVLRNQNNYYRNIAYNALAPYFKRMADGAAEDLLDSLHTPQAEYESLNAVATTNFDNYSPGGSLDGVNSQFEEWEAEKYVPQLAAWRIFIKKAIPNLVEIDEQGKNLLDQKNSLDGRLAVIKQKAEAEVAEKLRANEARIATAKAKLKVFPTIDDYLTDLSPASYQKTLTDGDGKYSFFYPRDNNFMIFASAQRTTPNGVEKYWWLVNAPAHTKSVQLFLSNNNLTHLASLRELNLN
jgi:hypothetical protein